MQVGSPKVMRSLRKLAHTYNTCANSSKAVLNAFAVSVIHSVEEKRLHWGYDPRGEMYTRPETCNAPEEEPQATTRGGSMLDGLTINLEWPDEEDFVMVDQGA